MSAIASSATDTITKDRLSTKISRRIRKISIKHRLIATVLAMLVVGVAAWRLEASPAQAALAVGVGMVGLNILLTFLPWLSVAIAWVYNFFALWITASAHGMLGGQGYGYSVWDFYMSLGILGASSILFTILAYRYAPGRLWFNLFVMFTLQSFLGVVLAALIADLTPQVGIYAAFFGIALAGAYLVARILVARKRSVTKTQPLPLADENTVRSTLSKVETDLKDSKFRILENPTDDPVEPSALIVGTHSITAVYVRKPITPLTFSNRGRARYLKSYLEDFSALSLSASATLAKTLEREQVRTLVVGHRLLTTGEPMNMQILTREGQELGVVTYSNPQGVARLVRSYRDSAVSKNQRAKLLELLDVVADEPEDAAV